MNNEKIKEIGGSGKSLSLIEGLCKVTIGDKGKCLILRKSHIEEKIRSCEEKIR